MKQRPSIDNQFEMRHSRQDNQSIVSGMSKAKSQASLRLNRMDSQRAATFN